MNGIDTVPFGENPWIELPAALVDGELRAAWQYDPSPGRYIWVRPDGKGGCQYVGPVHATDRADVKKAHNEYEIECENIGGICIPLRARRKVKYAT